LVTRIADGKVFAQKIVDMEGKSDKSKNEILNEVVI
jgi:hypothetical protein